MNHTKYTKGASARRYLISNDTVFKGWNDYLANEWSDEYETASEHWQRRYEAGRHLAAAYKNHDWLELKGIPKRLTHLTYSFARDGYFG